jgi:hypothetical protein
MYLLCNALIRLDFELGRQRSCILLKTLLLQTAGFSLSSCGRRGKGALWEERREFLSLSVSFGGLVLARQVL